MADPPSGDINSFMLVAILVKSSVFLGLGHVRMRMYRDWDRSIQHLLRPDDAAFHPAIDADAETGNVASSPVRRQKCHSPRNIFRFADLGHRDPNRTFLFQSVDLEHEARRSITTTREQGSIRRLSLKPVFMRIIETTIVHRRINPPRRHGIDARFTVQPHNLVLDRSNQAVLQARFPRSVIGVSGLAVDRRLRAREHDTEVIELSAVLFLPCLGGEEEILDGQEGSCVILAA